MGVARWIALVALVGCAGSTDPDPLPPNSCIGDPSRFCDDFDVPTPEATTTPFGFSEFLGGDTTEVIVIAENGNRGLSVTSAGAAFGQSGPLQVGSATSAVVQAKVELVETPVGGKSSLLGMILFDPSALEPRQVWIVAHDDGTLSVDALGTSLPAAGTLELGTFATLRLAASWITGGTQITIDASAGPIGAPVPILDSTALDLAPVPQVGGAIAVRSLDPGTRRFVFDDVTVDLR